MKYASEIKTRLLWLLIGLFMSLGIAKIIESFESTLQQNLILASFIPLVVYMSDAVGTQMEAMIIRRLHKRQHFDFMKFLKEQGVIVIAVALIIGLVSGLAIFVFKGSIELAIVIGASLFCGIISSLLTGTLMPYLFWKLHNDPAEASGPIATVIQDALSVVIFFLIATALL